jgi:hypothetical protein
MADESTEPDATAPEHKPALASGTEWQRVAPGQSIEAYREVGQLAAERMRRGSKLEFYSWVQLIAVFWYDRTEHGLYGDGFAGEANAMGVAPTAAKSCVHLFPDLDKLVEWGETVADDDRTRTGLPEGHFPTQAAMIRRFPTKESAVQKKMKADARAAKKAEARAKNKSEAEVRKEMLEQHDVLIRQKRDSESALARERELRETAERRVGLLRQARDEAERERDAAFAERDAAFAERDALLTELGELKNALTPDSPVVAVINDNDDAAKRIVEPIIDPVAETVIDESIVEPRRIRNGMLSLDEIKALEANHHIKGWRGHGVTSLARQLRADFISRLSTIEQDDAPPQRLLDQPAQFWEGQNGVLIDDLIAAYPDDDPPPSPSPEQTPPSSPEPPPTSPSPTAPQQTPPSPEPPSDPTPPSPVEEPLNSVNRATHLIRRRESEYKRLHEPNQSESRSPAATDDPDLEPPPSTGTQPVQPAPDPEPDPLPTLRPIPGERGQTPFDAIDEVYHLPIETTCQMVADVLRRYPLDQWDRDDFDRLVEGLEGRAGWSQCAAIVEPFFALDTTDSHKLFCTEAEGVLEYRDGSLEICSWGSIGQRIAPAMAEAKQRHAQRRREQRGRDILHTRLPKVRKLKAMKVLIDEILTCQPTISGRGQQAFEHIRAMPRDDPQFADCTTFMQYLDKANEIIEQIPV